MHQFVAARLAVYNPDEPERPVNTPNAVYQIEPELLKVLKTYGTSDWEDDVKTYLSTRNTLAQKYAKERTMTRIPVRSPDGKELVLSGGMHSSLIKSVIEEFAPDLFQARFLCTRATPARSGDSLTKLCYQSWASKLTHTAKCLTLFCISQRGTGWF